MYTRMLHFESDPANKPEILKIVDEIMPIIKTQEGCKDVRFIMHDSDGNYAILVDWETIAHADAAVKIIGPKLTPAIEKISKGPVHPRLYENYEPK